MRALAWLFWVGFVVATCSTAVSAPMVTREAELRPGGPASLLALASLTLLLLSLSLYVRFQSVGGRVAAGQLRRSSARVLLLLITGWMLGLVAVGGAIALFWATGGNAAISVGVGGIALLVVVAEAPYFRARAAPSTPEAGSGPEG